MAGEDSLVRAAARPVAALRGRPHRAARWRPAQPAARRGVQDVVCTCQPGGDDALDLRRDRHREVPDAARARAGRVGQQRLRGPLERRVRRRSRGGAAAAHSAAA
eukprot:6856842-Prymnesium_polylepis.1